MNLENANQEKRQIEDRIRQIQANMVRKVEEKKFLGLDSQVRRIQKNYQLMGRI